MDTEGLEAVTMRRVAREVGVEAMSLYNHVHDKDDLLNGVVERVMGEFPFPTEMSGEDWLETGRGSPAAGATCLRAHPSAIQLFAERKTPMASDRQSATDGRRADRFAQRRAVGPRRRPGVPRDRRLHLRLRDDGDGSAVRRPGAGSKRSPTCSADRLPSVAACAPFFADCDFDEQFEFGLDLMIEGLRAKVATG